jgi:hypothetical protein
MHDLTASWIPVFGVIITMDVITGVLALIALKPMRRAYKARMQ